MHLSCASTRRCSSVHCALSASSARCLLATERLLCSLRREMTPITRRATEQWRGAANTRHADPTNMPRCSAHRRRHAADRTHSAGVIRRSSDHRTRLSSSAANNDGNGWRGEERRGEEMDRKHRRQRDGRISEHDSTRGDQRASGRRLCLVSHRAIALCSFAVPFASPPLPPPLLSLPRWPPSIPAAPPRRPSATSWRRRM